MAMCDYYLCDVCGCKGFYDTSVTDERYEYAKEDQIKFVCSDCYDLGYRVEVTTKNKQD